MSRAQYSFVFLGLSVTSSWGNGHATTYRSLLRELHHRGHKLLFLERELSFYRDNRDLYSAPYADVELYASLDELRDRFADAIRQADMVIVGSYVPDGIDVIDYVLNEASGKTAFYDIDTPVTVSKLRQRANEYIAPAQIGRLDLYLSFTGGPFLRTLESLYRAKRARPLFCSADPSLYYPEKGTTDWDLGYLGTYSDDRQPALDALLVRPARVLAEKRFVVAGAQYPPAVEWPHNVERVEHLPPLCHRSFYNAQRFTLNVTRRDMVRAGYSPSVRMFEAGACGTPMISDVWPGLESFFAPGREILLAHDAATVVSYLVEMREEERAAIGRRAHARVLAEHTAAHRAEALEKYVDELFAGGRARASPSPHAAAPSG